MSARSILIIADPNVAGPHSFHHSYKRLVNFWQLYDNSVDPPRLLDEGANT